MKTTKKFIALVLCLAMVLSLPQFALAVNAQGIPDGSQRQQQDPPPAKYQNINTTSLSRGANYIDASCTVKSNMNLKIAVKVYKNGVLVNSYSTTDYGQCILFYTSYTFTSGADYKVEATYTAGSEIVTKTLKFKA